MTLIVHRPDAFAARPKAVLFDLDNTFYEYAPAHRAGLAAVHDKAANLLAISGDQFKSVLEEARRQVKGRLGTTAASHSRLLYFQCAIELLGMKTQPLLALDLEQTYWRTFLGTARLADGLNDFLDDLRIGSVPMAIVTDLTAQIQFRKLVFFGLEHVVDVVVTSEEVGQDKPHPAPFRLALEKLGVSEPPVWMIGDGIETDMAGAKAAVQATTLLRTHHGIGNRKPDAADLAFDSFADLRRFSRDLILGTSS